MKISPKNSRTGLTIFCLDCNTTINGKCRKSGRRRCPNPHRLVYKVYVHIPGTRNKRITKTLGPDIEEDEAARLAVEFTKEIKQKFRQNQNLNISKDVHQGNTRGVEWEKDIPRLFVDAASFYVGYLRGENIPEHHKKHIRSEPHVKDIMHAFAVFTESMQKNRVNMASLRIDEITDEMVGVFHSYTIKELQYSGRTHDKIMGHLSSLINFYNEKFKVSVPNYFKNVERRNIPGIKNPESISQDDFQRLLKATTKLNGIKQYPDGSSRYLFKDYLVDAWKLGLNTGCRREELINMTFSDIVIEKDGLKYIMVPDLKVNRIRNIQSGNQKIKYVPITSGLWKVLQDLGYEKYKGTDRPLLAPGIQENRVRVIGDSLSKGFSHFYSLLNTGRKLSFKTLRKTFATQLSLYMDAKRITGHSSSEVLKSHYIDREAIVRATEGFTIFPEEKQRNPVLKKHREKIDRRNSEKDLEI